MLRRFSINFALFSIGLDGAIILLSFNIATRLRPALNALPFAAPVELNLTQPWQLYPLFAITWLFILLLLNIYDGRRNLRVKDEITGLTMGSLIAMVSMAGMLYLTYREVSRVLFLFFILLAYILLLSWRLIARMVFRYRGVTAVQQRRVLIAGAGPVGRELQAQFTQHSYLGLQIAGFLDDDPGKLDCEDDIIASLTEARRVVTDNKIEDVIIALPEWAHKRINKLVADLSDLPVKVWIIPDYFHLAMHKASVEEFAGIPLLDLRAPALSDYQRMIKRAFDLLISLLLLPLALLAMGGIALAIRLEGPGPILFRQKRVGENGRLFNMLKFRTMVPEAENLRHLVEHYDESGNLIHKTRNDPRVTRVGAFLRSRSLDELPQIFNIIRGDMSLVGPRPELPYLVERYEPWQRKRFAVPQGITGWWQVNGRSDKPMHLNTEDDLYYVQHYSLLLDLRILFKTIGVVLRGKGAF